ncbi:MAG: hypothetical protein H6624_08185 [Bdellovibrionaceae bacterium]|nr:hypothetical protein [Bdellovibrionales bacterium]MCB9084310.1 hypothetical protein [Pseudobdellovibrionaceae bacterium]
MRFERLVWLWLSLMGLMAWEYWCLNHYMSGSIIVALTKVAPQLKSFNLSTEAGKPISYFLGWAGLSVMLVTNLYVLRKRIPAMHKMGRLDAWLDYHIFCGLLGPTLIVFHTDFKVGGLVAISFWSMMISAGSGVLGRYFFVKVSRSKAQLDSNADTFRRKLFNALEKANISTDDPDYLITRKRFFDFVGAPDSRVDFLGAVWGSLAGDVRLMMFSIPRVQPEWPQQTRKYLYGWAMTTRDSVFMEPFRKALGYWHAFHVPFTSLMYVTALVHVVVALAFGV